MVGGRCSQKVSIESKIFTDQVCWLKIFPDVLSFSMICSALINSSITTCPILDTSVAWFMALTSTTNTVSSI